MAKVKRVFEVAKELGVGSKAIVDKCVAEGVPGITNHMSVVKIGLEATVREWFSETAAQAQHTAVETAAPVDLTKARKARRKRAGESAADETGVGEATAATLEAERVEPSVRAVEEPEKKAPPESASVVGQAAAIVSVVAGGPEVAEKKDIESRGPAGGEAAALLPGGGVLKAAASAVAPAAPTKPAVGPMGRPNVPNRPAALKPMGKQLEKPTEAVLRGPKVVRIEKADVIEPPRPRRGPGGGPGVGRGPTAPGGGMDQGDAGITRSRGPVRGRGAGSGPGVAEEEAEGAAGAKKRHSLTTRRGRFAEALPTGPTKFSEQDLIELDARLNRATGYLKQRRRDMKKRSTGTAVSASPAVSGVKVEVSDPITIKAFSNATGIKSTDIIKYLFNKGIMATINSAIAAETAMEVALEYDIELEVKEQHTAEQLVVQEFEQRQAIDLRLRPPVVTVLGHVDHGKTSLLDRIRKADVAAHEAGGITQHVGAYRVTIKGSDEKEKRVVFLDTPGHEAFTSMRARGASMTDLVVLVVAADDGVMPQTIESINHAKAANVPIIVALNKIDKPEATEANIRKIYGQLAEHGLNPTEWGGTTEVMKVSATTGQGVTELLEVLDYQAELLDLKADYGGAARGTVIESQMQPGRGPVARVLVQQGKMKLGDFVVVGRAFGRVRDMSDDHGNLQEEAGPATPLELSGIDLIPDAGDKFYVTDSLQKAEEIASNYREKERTAQLANQTKVTLDNFAEQMQAGGMKELRVVLKADVQGSIDVLKKSLSDLATKEVSVKVLHWAVGGITESDVLLAEASDAVVIGFHVIAPPMVRDLAEQKHVEIRLYRIIYEITDDLKKSLEGMLEPESKEEVLGSAEVREVFKITKLGNVAGCMVTEGVIQRSAKMRVTRDSVVVADNRNIESLRRLKEDAKEVRAGMECGVRLVGFDDVKPGDRLICYNTIMVKRKLA